MVRSDNLLYSTYIILSCGLIIRLHIEISVESNFKHILIWTVIVSRPDPTLCKGKDLVNLDTILGPGKGIWTFQCFIAVIWLANHRNAMCHHLLCKFKSSARAHAALLTNQTICFSITFSACPLSRPNQGSKFTRPLFPHRGWGLGMRLELLSPLLESCDPYHCVFESCDQYYLNREFEAEDS